MNETDHILVNDIRIIKDTNAQLCFRLSTDHRLYKSRFVVQKRRKTCRREGLENLNVIKQKK